MPPTFFNVLGPQFAVPGGSGRHWHRWAVSAREPEIGLGRIDEPQWHRLFVRIRGLMRPNPIICSGDPPTLWTSRLCSRTRFVDLLKARVDPQQAVEVKDLAGALMSGFRSTLGAEVNSCATVDLFTRSRLIWAMLANACANSRPIVATPVNCGDSGHYWLELGELTANSATSVATSSNT